MRKFDKIHIGILLLCLLIVFVDANNTTDSYHDHTNMLKTLREKRQLDRRYVIREWTIRDVLPGEPDKDYPILNEIPDTDFSCNGRPEGYYADVAARCQVFRICANTANDTGKGFAFLCPNGTLFNQEFFVCDWYMSVNCENSDKFYHLNEQIGQSMAQFSYKEIVNSARDVIMFPMASTSGKGTTNIYKDYPKPLSNIIGIGSGTKQKEIKQKADTESTRFSGNRNKDKDRNVKVGAVGSIGQAGTVGSIGSVVPSSGPQVFVNSLGQLSTDSDSGFDPKYSFVIKPNSDSNYEFDFPLVNHHLGPTPSPSQTIGTIDLSGSPFLPNSNRRKDSFPGQKQIYTYPSNVVVDRDSNNPQSSQDLNSLITNRNEPHRRYGSPPIPPSVINTALTSTQNDPNKRIKSKQSSGQRQQQQQQHPIRPSSNQQYYKPQAAESSVLKTPQRVQVSQKQQQQFQQSQQQYQQQQKTQQSVQAPGSRINTNLQAPRVSATNTRNQQPSGQNTRPIGLQQQQQQQQQQQLKQQQQQQQVKQTANRQYHYQPQYQESPQSRPAVKQQQKQIVPQNYEQQQQQQQQYSQPIVRQQTQPNYHQQQTKSTKLSQNKSYQIIPSQGDVETVAQNRRPPVDQRTQKYQGQQKIPVTNKLASLLDNFPVIHTNKMKLIDLIQNLFHPPNSNVKVTNAEIIQSAPLLEYNSPSNLHGDPYETQATANNYHHQHHTSNCNN